MLFAERIKPEVQAALTGFLARRGRPEPQHLEIVKIVERPFSSVIFFRDHNSNESCDAVLKKIKHHEENISLTTRENQARTEYEMLCRLFPGFRDVDGCSVPEPIALFPEEEAYLMEYVPGRLLCEKLKGARYFAPGKKNQELEKYYLFCGKWLRNFQEVTGMRKASSEIFSTTMARCEQKLSLIEEANDPRCPPGLKSAVLSFMHEELARLDGEEIPVAGRHSDFGGWNILVNESGVTVIDFLGCEEDAVAVDLLKMLVNLEDEKKYLSYSKKRLARLSELFLAGYGRVPEIQKPVALICEALHRVCSLCASVVHVDGLMLHRKIEKKLSFKEHLRWLLADRKTILWPGPVR